MAYEIEGEPPRKTHDHQLEPGVKVRIIDGQSDRIGQTGVVATTYPGVRAVSVQLDNSGGRLVTGYDYVEITG
jgi:hypothetical protein